jgi:hypothetical protein
MAAAPDPRASEAELKRLHEKLADVARQTARLLLQPAYDPADLARLDEQAAGLRARISSATPRPPADDFLPELRLPLSYGGRPISGR